MTVPRKDTPEDERKRSRFFWLLLIPLMCLVPICLWLTSQAASIGLVKGSVPEDIGSGLFANYGTWEPGRFNPVNPDLIGTIRADQATAVAGPGLVEIIPFVPIIDLPGLTQIAAVASPTPAPSATPVPATSTPRPLPTAVAMTATPIASVTPIPTSTNAPPPPPPPPPTATPVAVVPTAQFTLITTSVNEGMVAAAGSSGDSYLLVTLSAASASAVTVEYYTTDGTAVSTGDYAGIASGTPQTLTFPAGTTSIMLPISIVNDTDVESTTPETLTVTLQNPVGALLGAQSSAVLKIVDDDAYSACSTTGALTSATIAYPSPASNAAPPWPDGNTAGIGCTPAVFTLSASLVTDGASSYDLIYYESGNGSINLDWVIIQVRASVTDPWYTVFYWGDGIPDANSSVAGAVSGCTPAGTEQDNCSIGNPPLIGAPASYTGSASIPVSGIQIDIDSVVPAGTYSYIQVIGPRDTGGDVAQMDAIVILP